jgi:hypothetical protein
MDVRGSEARRHRREATNQLLRRNAAAMRGCATTVDGALADRICGQMLTGLDGAIFDYARTRRNPNETFFPALRYQ